MQAIGVTDGQQAKPLVSPPDLLTALRIPLAVAFLLVPSTTARVVIVAVAAASDLLDGMWARRIGGSRLGVALDPVADKLFVLAAFVTVLQSRMLAWYEIIGVLLRDIVAAIAFFGTVVRRRPTTLPARAGGKAVTVCQLLTLLAFLAGSDLVRPLAWATAAISVYAIADYMRVGLAKS
jgi:CDP-diacylglycerol--glycerol-3-phosphate 3-phosphatidyltransferase/cardiolipin synthase